VDYKMHILWDTVGCTTGGLTRDIRIYADHLNGDRMCVGIFEL